MIVQYEFNGEDFEYEVEEEELKKIALDIVCSTEEEKKIINNFLENYDFWDDLLEYIEDYNYEDISETVEKEAYQSYLDCKDSEDYFEHLRVW